MSNLSRSATYQLVKDETKNQNLIKHMFSVEACMRAYARKFNQDEEIWAVTGLVHDFDYEKYPHDHPNKGLEILKDQGYSEEIIEAIAGHVRDGKRESLLAKALYAVDELAGFIIAVALMRPEKLEGISVKSIKKKLKDKSFAAAIDREEIIKSASDLGVELDDHLNLCIQALQEIKNELRMT